MSAWIELLSVVNATGKLKKAFEEAKTPSGTVDNVMRVHSHRPHTMLGHLALYKSVLHNSENILPLWFLETVGVYTSLLNCCDYSYTHHLANMRSLLKNDEYADIIENALNRKAPEDAFSGKELLLLNYTFKLTTNPGAIEFKDLEKLKSEGASDGEILEVNQVCAYFCYSNRTINGLGVELEGDTVGYYQKK